MTVSDSLLDATMRLLSHPQSDGPPGAHLLPSVAAIAREAGTSRQTLYRLFPGGVEEIRTELERQLTTEILRGLENSVETLVDRMVFEAVVGAAVWGAHGALISHPYGRAICASSWTVRASYALAPQPGGIRDRLVRYAARCAAVFGSELSSKEIVDSAQVFVLQVLLELLSEPSLAAEDVNRCAVDDIIHEFVHSVRLEDPTRKLSQLAVLPV